MFGHVDTKHQPGVSFDLQPLKKIRRPYGRDHPVMDKYTLKNTQPNFHQGKANTEVYVYFIQWSTCCWSAGKLCGVAIEYFEK